MKATRFSAALAIVLAAVVSSFGTMHSGAQSPSAPVSPTAFRDIARRENPTVVSVIARSRVDVALSSGFLIDSTGDILTNNHVVDGAERIEVSLFGNERKRYRAVRVGSDRLTDTALIRLKNPPPDLQAATLGDSSALEPGESVMAIGNPYQLEHTVTVGVVSFARRPLQVADGRWQDMIQTDASINVGSSGGPLFNLRGEVVGINVAMLDADNGTAVGIGFAVPINAVKPLLPQLRKGRVVRGQLGVQLHGGPILEDEATELSLPNAIGAIVRRVDRGSAAERAGLRAGDVIIEVDGCSIADTRDLIARTAATPPGTSVIVKTFRRGQEQTHTVTIEEQPTETVKETRLDRSEDDDGLTLGEIPPRTAKQRAQKTSAGRGALVVEVAPNSHAEEAELVPGDIIRAINGRPIYSVDQARRELHEISSGRPIFLLVSRHTSELFLEIRKN